VRARKNERDGLIAKEGDKVEEDRQEERKRGREGERKRGREEERKRE